MNVTMCRVVFSRLVSLGEDKKPCSRDATLTSSNIIVLLTMISVEGVKHL